MGKRKKKNVSVEVRIEEDYFFDYETKEEAEEGIHAYGLKEFTEKALYLVPRSVLKEFNLEKVFIVGEEYSKRIFLKNEEGQEFVIRYHIDEADEKSWDADFTLFATEKDDDGSHGVDIAEGFTDAKYNWDS